MPLHAPDTFSSRERTTQSASVRRSSCRFSSDGNVSRCAAPPTVARTSCEPSSASAAQATPEEYPGYEDEKFAYLVASRVEGPAAASGRILRHPRVEKGRIALTLCTAEGVVREVVTRRDADAWRAARKVESGDAWGTARAPDEP